MASMKSVIVVSVLTMACGKSDPPPAPAPEPGLSANATTSPEARAVLDKHAAMTKAKWDALVAVATEAKSAPPVAKPEPLATPVKSPLVVPEAQMRTPGDTVLVSPEAVVDGAMPPSGFGVQPLLKDYVDLVAPGSKTMIKPDVLEADFSKIAGLKYALFARVRETTPSKTQTAVIDGKGELRYTAGSMSGDAILFDLDAKKRLGAFPFAFQAKGDYLAKSGESPDEETKRLAKHLHDSVKSQLLDAASTFATGGAAPAANVTAAAAAGTADVQRAILVEAGTKHPGAGVGAVKIDGAVVTIEATNPAAIAGADLQALTAFASKQIGRDVKVTVVKK
jgi:hypothetical protein